MRLQLMRLPDALHRAQRQADRLGHRPAGPMDRLVRRFGETLDPRFGEAPLPAPHRRPADAEALGNPLRRSPTGRSEHDARALDILLPLIAVGHNRLQPFLVRSADDHTYCLSHRPNIAHSMVNLLNASEQCRASFVAAAQQKMDGSKTAGVWRRIADSVPSGTGGSAMAGQADLF